MADNSTTDTDSVITHIHEKETEKPKRSHEDEVRSAISLGNWARLRELSLLPGGFGEARVDAWMFLLNVPTKIVQPEHSDEANTEVEPHKDERQVGLDTDRSFVLYPVDKELSGTSKADLKAELHHVIVHVLRKRPTLSYFQGYHDVLSVLLLTFREHQDKVGDQFKDAFIDQLNTSAEKLSLHRLRDAMGPGLEPLVGLLRLVKQLLRAADPVYSKQLSSASPLPYFALSNLLTYFSHDVPTLPIIQHIFDYLLSRPPISIVYLTAALILVRKEEIQRLCDAGDEGMIHAYLCNFPDLIDADTLPQTEQAKSVETETESIKDSDTLFNSPSETEDGDTFSQSELSVSQSWSTAGDSHAAVSLASSQSWTRVETETPSPGISPTLAPVPLTVTPPTKPRSLPTNPDIDSTLEFPPIEPLSPLSSGERALPDESAQVESSSASRLSLVSLLEQADDLYRRYSPSSIKVSSIMGPQSVLFTWCETPEGAMRGSIRPQRDQWSSKVDDFISDDMAEKMVLRPELTVKAWKDEDEEEIDREVELAKMRRKKFEEDRIMKRRRERKYGVAMLGRGRGSVVMMGGMVIVVVVGVAIAVYGKNGLEWRKWMGRSPWLPRSLQLKSS
ncbi:hypothetical protein FRC14_006440 [Serendipita sp. 396]|nr:hypothetical protein FRC14_006440 [Serendipita sp. 396]